MSVQSSPSASEIAQIEDTSLLAFYRDMNVPERRTFWACASGWALDGMDFMIYPLVIGTIIALWKVDPGTAGLAGTVTLLASASAAGLPDILADRIGRVLTLQITILWFSFFSLVCAFVQNFDQLLIARALLGLGFGGEWAAGAVLMGEAIRAQYRGRAVGSVQSGWAVGWGLAVLSQAVLFSYLPAGDCLALDVCRLAHCQHCLCFFCAAMSKSQKSRRRLALKRPQPANDHRSGKFSQGRS